MKYIVYDPAGREVGERSTKTEAENLMLGKSLESDLEHAQAAGWRMTPVPEPASILPPDELFVADSTGIETKPSVVSLTFEGCVTIASGARRGARRAFHGGTLPSSLDLMSGELDLSTEMLNAIEDAALAAALRVAGLPPR